jgi:phosphoglycolate phosphatase-like HAD superfamily hydrolase
VTPQPLRALIFDFDGVILDSNSLKTQAFRIVFSRFPQHAAAMMAYHDRHVSRSRYEKFGHLVEDLLGRKGDRALIEQLADAYADVLRTGMDTCAFVPGARALLEDVSARVPLYLASVTPEPELLRLLEIHRVRQYFTRVFGCPPWTKPDAVGAIVEQLGGPSGVALVGDSAGDQRAALAHGVEFVPRDSGLPFHPPLPAETDLFRIADALRPRLAT